VNRLSTTLLQLSAIMVAVGTTALPAGAQSVLGEFTASTDVGRVSHAGTASYDARTGAYALTGSGANVWAERDAFHYVWRKMKGDFILTTRGTLLGKGVEAHRKLGWMVRSSLDSGSAHASAVVHGDGLTSLQFRRAAGGSTEEVKSPITGANVIQLERRGTTYIMSVAHFGDTLSVVQQADLALGDDVYVGLFVCAHNDSVVERASFRDVRITVPVGPNFVPYRQYLGSNLEILDVATGQRRIIYRSPVSIQAPNWTRDGKALIYNQQGRLYRFDLARGTPTEINTGSATNNNNDHVISTDGKKLGISNGPPDDSGKSNVYTVPITGGVPTRVTKSGPSYLHGWSRDDRYLTYVGIHGDTGDIYRIPVTGGTPVKLTNVGALNDGPEYGPDARIYFNSTRSGLMQLWRMNADGSAQTQLSNDGFNNWFPHVSPDGRSIVFITFLPDVRPTDHPWYKHVYIRRMPAGGGAASVLAYVYGGQGTINVPSWSPDGRHIAFVSNSDHY
jgi:Tol biopolymer transport system component